MIFIFTYPAGRLARKWGNKKTYMVAIALVIILFVELFAVSGKSQIGSLVVMSLMGIVLAATALLNGPLYFEIIDKDELITGKRRETTYAGMNALFVKPAISVANALFFWILALYGYISPTDTMPNPVQPESAYFGIRLAFTLIPAACLVVALFFMIFYRLSGPEWDKQKKKLADIHLKKEQEYIKKLAAEGKISAMYKKFEK